RRTRGQRGGRVEPQFREARSVRHGVGGTGRDRVDGPDLLTCELRRDVVVDRTRAAAGTHGAAHTGEHLAELAEHLTELRGIEALTAERVVAPTAAGESESEGHAATGAAATGTLVLPAVGVVVGIRESEGRVAHVSNGTRRPGRGPASWS